MGVYRCSIHGMNGIAALCAHAADQVERGLLEPTHIASSLECCDACFRSGQPVEEEACCAMCVDAARIHGARTRGEPDPFVVYEHALWPIDRELLSELRASLLSRFTFPISGMSSYEPHPALYVVEGSFRSPVCIEAYGILEVTTQDAITALVKTFFAALTRNQAQLTFFEAMIVEEWTTPEGHRVRSHRRDKERVLRVEVFGATPS
jgi:hypothetical protein